MRDRPSFVILGVLLATAGLGGCASGSASAAVPDTARISASAGSTAAPAARASWAESAIQESGSDPSVLHVTGNAQIEVEPDRARVSFAVETQAGTAREAAEANARQMEAVMRAVRESSGGVAGFRIETAGYTLMPRYRPRRDGQGSEIEGYTARNSVLVTIDEVEAVGGVMDSALRSGANRMSGLSFLVRDPTPHRHRALQNAVTLARQEAEVTAAALGMRLGEALEVQIQGSYSPVQARGMEMEMAMADSPSTPVEAGAQFVSASVSIQFRLLPRED